MTPIVIHNTPVQWHAPASGDLRHVVLLCNTLGDEGLYVYRPLVALAEDLAQAGLGVLRFSFPDQDDGVDLAPDADAIAESLNTLQALLAWVQRQWPGVAVSLCGYRMGALLAAEVAARSPGLLGLALLAPVPSGRLVLRELALKAGQGVAADAALVQDGWHLSPASRQTLAGLDWQALLQQSPPHGLVLSDTGLRAAEKLAGGLAQAGATGWRVQAAEDLVSLRAYSHLVTVPEVAFSELVRWLVGLPLPAAVPQPAPRLDLPAPSALNLPQGTERSLRLGPQGRLAGVLCTPPGCEASSARADSPCLLILNTAGNPSAGQSRSAVQLARALAVQGVSSLRVDVRGNGNSLPVQRGRNWAMYTEAPIEDVSAALDCLQQQGWAQPAVFGLCSGAYLALQAAVQDPRMGRLLLVNLQSFLWQGEPFGAELEAPVGSSEAGDGVQLKHMGRYKQIIFTLDFWRRLLAGEVHVWGVTRRLVARLSLRVASRVQASLPAGWVLLPQQAEVQERMARLTRRALPITLIYGDTDAGLNELEALFGRQGQRLTRQPGVALHLVADADHMFIDPPSLQTLIRQVGEALCTPAARPA
ncbi:hypothetical protein PSQ39_09650 [Curvibacter sp. HBC28]|uniref:Serine aminopeptidase S33 domain-containing protein n=1 Tax=Curvibacter microcysteis TaxID=3026419 RepID=A0ABT5MID5_9BURK|nr:hypothetical protein [Curvibacter sp. HBC28]MDD0814891.1 hypothetical protein [Curvibacter sp. HBC28]